MTESSTTFATVIASPSSTEVNATMTATMPTTSPAADPASTPAAQPKPQQQMQSASSSLTPTRTNGYVSHNTQTPIASIKRPRSSLERRTPHNTVSASRAAAAAQQNSATASDPAATTTGTEVVATTPVRQEMTPKTVTMMDRSSPLDCAMEENNDAEFTAIETDTPDAADPVDIDVENDVQINQDDDDDDVMDTYVNMDPSNLSPLHPPRPVVSRQPAAAKSASSAAAAAENISTASSWGSAIGANMDALFSPVLHLFNDKTKDDDNDQDEPQPKSQEHDIDDEDYDAAPINVCASIVTNLDSTSLDITPSQPNHVRTCTTTTHPSPTGGADAVEDVDLEQVNEQDTQLQLDHEQHNTNTITLAPCTPSNNPLRDDDCDSTGSLQAVEDLDDDFNPWQFIKALPPYNYVRASTPAVTLPPKSPTAPPITLVLDLDETLVHCSVEEPPSCDLSFGVEFHGIDYQVYVKLRPHLHRFLEAVSKQFEVVVFTASQPVYANELLNRIEKLYNSNTASADTGINNTINTINNTDTGTNTRKLVHYRLFRESCLHVEGNFLKDLTVLGRDLSQTVLVDNSPHAFGYQLDNGIPIESWFDDPHDRELLKLERFLRRLHGCTDVRQVLREKFQNSKRVAEAPDYPGHHHHNNHYQYQQSQQQQQQQEQQGGSGN